MFRIHHSRLSGVGGLPLSEPTSPPSETLNAGRASCAYSVDGTRLLAVVIPHRSHIGMTRRLAHFVSGLQPVSRAAPVPSRGGGRVWSSTLTYGKGQSRCLAISNPSSTHSRRQAPRVTRHHHCEIRAGVPELSHAPRTRQVPRDTTGGARRRSLGRLPETLSGERRLGLGPRASDLAGAV